MGLPHTHEVLFFVLSDTPLLVHLSSLPRSSATMLQYFILSCRVTAWSVLYLLVISYLFLKGDMTQVSQMSREKKRKTNVVSLGLRKYVDTAIYKRIFTACFTTHSLTVTTRIGETKSRRETASSNMSPIHVRSREPSPSFHFFLENGFHHKAHSNPNFFDLRSSPPQHSKPRLVNVKNLIS